MEVSAAPERKWGREKGRLAPRPAEEGRPETKSQLRGVRRERKEREVGVVTLHDVGMSRWVYISKKAGDGLTEEAHELGHWSEGFKRKPISEVPRRRQDSRAGQEPQGIERDRGLELGRASPSPSSQSSEMGHEELIQPKKLINPVKVSRSHQALHRELLLSHRRPVVEEKPELQRVLEHRRRQLQIRQRREEEQRRNASPLEQELLKRQQSMGMLERNLDNQRDKLASEPEFIRVKDSLRRTTSLV